MAKRARTGDKAKFTSTPRKKGRKNRAGFSSVARTRGASVTGEMKYFDTAGNFTMVASNDWTATEADPGTFLNLCNPVVGAAINQRIGRRVKVMKIKVRGHIVTPSQAFGATEDACLARLLLVQDKQTNSAQVQGETIMTPQAGAAFAVHSFQNLDNFGRFNVLSDKTIVIQDPNPEGANHNGRIVPFKMTHTFKKPVEVQFNATNGGTIADIVNDSFHVLCNCTDIDLAPLLQYVARVNYKE